MATLSKVFKTREEICLWLKENKPQLQEETGFEFTHINISNDMLIANVKKHPDFKLLIMPEFDFNDESLKIIENTLKNQPDDEKYIGVVMIAESFPEDFWEYYKTLRNYVRLILPLYLKTDKDNKPAFDYPKIQELTA